MAHTGSNPVATISKENIMLNVVILLGTLLVVSMILNYGFIILLKKKEDKEKDTNGKD